MTKTQIVGTACGATACGATIRSYVATPAANEQDVKWKLTPKQRTRIHRLCGANFIHFLKACPVKHDNTFVDGEALDAHIRRHEDLDAHYPFTRVQRERVIELAAQAGTPGFVDNLWHNAPVVFSEDDMNTYIEAHAPIAAEHEQRWIDLFCARERWWMYKHHGSDEVVTYQAPVCYDDAAKRIAEQQRAYEEEFPGVADRREEIRRLGMQAEKRVEELIKSWA